MGVNNYAVACRPVSVRGVVTKVAYVSSGSHASFLLSSGTAVGLALPYEQRCHQSLPSEQNCHRGWAAYADSVRTRTGIGWAWGQAQALGAGTLGLKVMQVRQEVYGLGVRGTPGESKGERERQVWKSSSLRSQSEEQQGGSDLSSAPQPCLSFGERFLPSWGMGSRPGGKAMGAPACRPHPAYAEPCSGEPTTPGQWARWILSCA